MNPLLSETEEAWVARARATVDTNRTALVDETETSGQIPATALTALRDLVGGVDNDIELALVVEEIARCSPAAASLVGAHAAARLAGVAIDGFLALALTGDCVAGAPDGSARLTGSLGLVAGAVHADAIVVAAGAADGETLFHVRPGDGVEIGPKAELMGLRGAGHAEIRLVDAEATPLAVTVPAVRDLLRIVQAARAVGLAQGTLDTALEGVAARRAAGDRADRSQSVQWMLADIATTAESARVSTYFAAAQPAGAGRTEAAAMCRLLAAEAAVLGARNSLQIAGESGARRGSTAERMYRDAKLMEIEGGTNEDQLRDLAALLLPDLPVA